MMKKMFMILKVNLFSLWQFSCVYILLKDVYYVHVKRTSNLKKKNVHDMKREILLMAIFLCIYTFKRRVLPICKGN